MKSDFAFLENFAHDNDQNECDLSEASNSKLWEDVVTAEDGVITIRCAVYTL